MHPSHHTTNDSARTSRRRINRVAVLGSGVMGSQIALLLAGLGLPVLLLDRVPESLTPAEESQGLSLSHPSVRNRIARESLAAAKKLKPDPAYQPQAYERITLGNLEDDLPHLAVIDWIVEVVVENLAIKRALYERVEAFRKPGSLITSNTSGIPIALMAEGRSADFRQHFCGTHFFNPPRYLRLLEVIPGRDTLLEVLDFWSYFGERILGKVVVRCQDTPAFIANRLGVYAILDVMAQQQRLGLSVEEIDLLTGPVLGRPKSATYRTADVVGLDTLLRVAGSLHENLKGDESVHQFAPPAYLQDMVQRGWTGEKGGQGFYKKEKSAQGESQILGLDIASLSYRAGNKPRFATLEGTRSIDNLGQRIPLLLAGTDAAGDFYRAHIGALLAYTAHRVPEISPELAPLDEALKAGFGWELGVFELWDLIGWEKGVELIHQAGKTLAPWVEKAQKAGIRQFYRYQSGIRQVYQPSTGAYEALPGAGAKILLSALKEGPSRLWHNAGASLYHLGDGILGLEFHTKMNTLGGEVIAGINEAISQAEKGYEGLVIGNQATHFSAGANLALVLMFAVEQEFDELDLMIRQFQQTMMRVRYSSIPVVVAPQGLSLGGGCEMSLHADRLQAQAETYMGLVETGVGLIPGGGGSKEMALRLSDRYWQGDAEINALNQVFTQVAMAKVSGSAFEARRMGYLRQADGISTSAAWHLADAKAQALLLAQQGYLRPTERTDIRVLGRTGLGTLLAGLEGMLAGGFISPYDKKVGEKLAWVLCGGDLSTPQIVSEHYLLDLEREAFLSLCGERKTQERIQSVLKTGKPVRN